MLIFKFIQTANVLKCAAVKNCDSIITDLLAFQSMHTEK